MKKLITLSALSIMTLPMLAQSIERKLVAVAGGTLAAGDTKLSFSIGEVMILPSPSLTMSFPHNAMLVSIGFQQPHVAKTGAIVHSYNWVSAYPNPVIDKVKLDIHGDNFQANAVRITNTLGQAVIAPFTFINGSIEIKMDNLPAGSYIIAVTDKSLGNTVSTQVFKQHN